VVVFTPEGQGLGKIWPLVRRRQPVESEKTRSVKRELNIGQKRFYGAFITPGLGEKTFAA